MNTNRSRLALCLTLLGSICVLGACSGMKPAHPPLATVDGRNGHFGMGRIIRLDTGEAVSFEALIAQLNSKEVIFVGEVHDNPEHHLIQVQILQALTHRYGSMPVAMEFFERPQQPIINRYMSGELDEDAFLKEVDWQGTWGFDYHFYRPLVLHTKLQGERLLAINAPRNIVRMVARVGLDGLAPKERARLASRIDLTDETHRAYMREIYRIHTHSDLEQFDYFYEAQCVWEDTMAENIAAHLKEAGGRIAVFCGNGHIMNRYGIPDRTRNRVPVSMAVILLHPLAEDVAFNKEAGDYVWLTGDAPRRRPMRMPKRHGKAER
ncbi:MAG: ChaN family lipoprotein [Deltaproteobacteria bacterium]|nr:ChaN family lipoprotein [Deltaproteobacteria bacterium]